MEDLKHVESNQLTDKYIEQKDTGKGDGSGSGYGSGNGTG